MCQSALVHAEIWSTALFTIALLTLCRRVLCKFFPGRRRNIKFVEETRRQRNLNNNKFSIHRTALDILEVNNEKYHFNSYRGF